MNELKAEGHIESTKLNIKYLILKGFCNFSCLQYGFLLLIFSFTGIAKGQSVSGQLDQELTIREMSPDESVLMLIDILAPTDSKLPKGTRISFTQGNTLPPFAFEDDQNPGEVIEVSRFPFQQNIRIDDLPGYSDVVKSELNAKRIFISEPQLSLVSLDQGSSLSAQAYHSCNEQLIQKVNGDRQLSNQSKKNFPSILAETIAAQKQFKNKSLKDDYIAFIDYSLPSAQKRFFLINLSSCQYQTEFVSHGSGVGGSGGTRSMLQRCATGAHGASTRTNRTRDGIYKIAGGHSTKKNWPVIGKIGGRNYKALKLESLDGKHTDVVSRGVVMHEAPTYVFNAPQTQGRSSGCPAFAKGRLKNMTDRLNGAVLNIYAPQCR